MSLPGNEVDIVIRVKGVAEAKRQIDELQDKLGDPRFGGAGSVKGGVLARLGLGALAGGGAGGGGMMNPWAIGAAAVASPGLIPPMGAMLSLSAFMALAVPTISKVTAAQAALSKAQAAAAAATTPAARQAAIAAEHAAVKGLSDSQIGLMHSITGVQTAFSRIANQAAPMIAKALQPVLGLARDLLPTVKVLAVAGGQVLDAFIKPLDKLINSGTWSSFIGDMAKFGVQWAKLFGPALATVIGDVLKLFVQLAPAGMALWRALTPLVTVLVGQFAGILGKLLPPLASALTGVVKAVTPLIAPMAQLTITLLPPLARLLGALIVPAVKIMAQVITSGLIPALIPLAKAVAQLVNALIPLLPPLTKLMLQIMPPLINLINKPMTDAFKGLTALLNYVVIPAIRFLVKWLTTALNWITGTFVPGVAGAWSTIKNNTTLIWGSIVKFFTGIPGDIARALSSLFQVGRTAMTNFWNGLKSMFGTILSGAEAFMLKLAGITTKAAVTGSAGHLPGPSAGQPSANAALARRMVPQWGSGANWNAWNYVAMRESGWNQFATNPTSGAYGIPQALPPTKMPFAAQAAGGSDPGAQIGWMAGYMQSVYGGPQGAAAHEQAFNWYGAGGPASGWIGVGERGRELVRLPPGSWVKSSADSGRMMTQHAGGTPVVVLGIRPGAGAEVERLLAWIIRRFVFVHGGGNVQHAFGQ